MGHSLKSYLLFARDDSLVPQAPGVFKKPKELWVAVHCPEIALSVWPHIAAHEPAAVVEAGGRGRILAANEAARRRGVVIGLKPQAAIAICRNLQLFEQSLREQQKQLQKLASHAFAFTPRVALHPPREFLFEIAGSQRLFGGLASIKSQLSRAIEAWQQFCMAAAPTALAAVWLARGRSEDLTTSDQLAGCLGRLGLGVTEWPEKVQAVLWEMGARKVGDCLRLPRDGFARRVGRQYLLELDNALGRAPDIRKSFSVSARLSYLNELEFEIDDWRFLMPIVEDLLDRLVADLRLRQAQIQALELILFHVHRPRTVERVELVDPAHQKDRLLRLVVDRCERMTLPAPVVAVVLNAGELNSMAGLQTRSLLLDQEESQEQTRDSAAQLIDLLRGRLGAEGVYCIHQVADHRPEKAWKKVAVLDARSDAALNKQTVRRPLWLLPKAIRLGGRETPLYKGRPLELLTGPERIETGWWDVDVSRDYYGARTADGERLWVYRERSRSVWHLHGFFG